MFSQEQLDHLRKEIADDLASLRIWRNLGDTKAAETINDRINLKLDRLRRFARKATPDRPSETACPTSKPPT